MKRRSEAFSYLTILVDEADVFFREIEKDGYKQFHPIAALRQDTHNRVKFVFAGTHNVAQLRSANDNNKDTLQLGASLCIKPLSMVDPLSLLDSGDWQKLEYRIWSAQLRVAFSIIEVERQNLIAKYEAELHDALSHSYLDRKTSDERWIENETGEKIRDPFDLEIGKLFFMTKVYRYPNGSEYFWQGTTPQDRQRIGYLRDRRNELAHLHIVDANDFLPLLYPEIPLQSSG